MIPGKTYDLDSVRGILRRRAWLIVVPMVVCSAAMWAYARSLPDRYRSETLILVVPQRVPESYVKSTVTARIEDRLQSISQQILSRTRLERVIQDFGLYPAQRRTGVLEDVVVRMRADIEGPIVINGSSFRIAYTGTDPRTVMQVTERLASLFIAENLRDRTTQAQGSYQFLDAQLADARLKLIEREKTLETFRRKYTGQLPSQLQSNLQMLQSTQQQIQATSEAIGRDRDRRLFLEREIADLSATAVATPAAVPSPIAGVPVAGQTVAEQLASAKDALAQLELRLRPEHPDVQRMRSLVAALAAKAAAAPAAVGSAEPVRVPVSAAEAARENHVNDLRAEIESLDRQIARREEDDKHLHAQSANYQSRVEATPALESELSELTRDYDTLQKGYTTLLAKKEDSKVAANMEQNQIGEQFRTLDPARLPEKPSSPNRLQLYALGVAGGLAVGLALIALLEYLDTTVRTEDEAARVFSLPVIALVPRLVTAADHRRARRWRWGIGVTASIVVTAAALLVAWQYGFMRMV